MPRRKGEKSCGCQRSGGKEPIIRSDGGIDKKA